MPKPDSEAALEKATVDLFSQLGWQVLDCFEERLLGQVPGTSEVPGTLRETSMSRKLPTFTPGHYYHLYNRGRSRLSIFHEAENYLFVLGKLKKYLAELQIAIIAYVLMPNHYHFLVRQDGDKAAGLLAQRIFNSYSKAYNKRFVHSGTLFEGPYDARHVHTDAYLRHLCRYIHANPVKDGLVQHIEEWPYSNYHEWMGLRAGTLIDREFVKDYFPDRDGYKEFVVDYLLDRRLADDLGYLREW